jgi:SEC-C motif
LSRTAPASISGAAEAIALARKTPLTRGAVAELARKVPAELAREAAMAALDTAGANAAMVLAFAAAAGGAKLRPELTRALLPEVSSLDHVGPLVFATEGKPLDVLVAFLEDKRGDLELECLVMLLAGDQLGDAPKVPAAMLTRGRWLARHQLVQEASVFLGGAALRIKNPDLSSLATPHVNRAKRAKKSLEETLDVARSAPLDVLSEADGARVSTGFTVRHETPSVGRNDPCPCGSGKKYKKCHALSEAPAPVSDAAPKIDATTLGPDQAALLRPSEIAALETAKLSAKAFVEAFRRVVDFRQWELALRMIAEAQARKDLGDGESTLFVLDALHAAYDARASEAAEALHRLLPDDVQRREAFAIECLRAPSDLLGRIEHEAEEALATDADGARGMLLASALLRWYPALGVYVARGALHEGRTLDSRALLEKIEDARDRLLLSPFEAWWDVYDAFIEGGEDRREQKKADAKREKMKEDLRRARAASRKLGAEMEKLQRRVAELDESIASAPAPSRKLKTDVLPAQTAPNAELTEERRRLKTKIDELQRIIGEGQEERRELRRQLAERDDEDDVPSTNAPSSAKKSDSDADAEPEGVHDAESVDAPRAVLVPRFSDRATKALTDLAADAADGVLTVVASLAAGKANVWGGVKQLTKVRGVLSARAGIHHRVLFAVNDRALDVLEVLHRRDLEQVVARLARASA